MNVHWVNKNTSGSTWDLGWCETNKHLIEETSKFGIVHDAKSEIAFHVSSPRLFRPIRGKKNAVFCMWESKDFPEEHRPYLHNADLLITSSNFCKEIFSEVVDCPVVVVPLGVDNSIWTSRRRVWQPGESFQWLIAGAPSARKGLDTIQDVWNREFYGREDCHLYCKLTTAKFEQPVQRAIYDGFEEHSPGVVYKDNVVLDFRKLPIKDLVETFHRSHGFVFPTAAEGFGLQLLEAMATSLPCIVTKYSGVLDFTTEETVKYVSWAPYENTYSSVDGDKAVLNSAMASVDDVAASMHAIMADYRSALKMGKRAARLAQTFTWEKTGQQVARILEQFQQTVPRYGS